MFAACTYQANARYICHKSREGFADDDRVKIEYWGGGEKVSNQPVYLERKGDSYQTNRSSLNEPKKAWGVLKVTCPEKSCPEPIVCPPQKECPADQSDKVTSLTADLASKMSEIENIQAQLNKALPAAAKATELETTVKKLTEEVLKLKEEDLAKTKSVPKACSRPASWCKHPGTTYRLADCMGNGEQGDHFCWDTLGQRGSIKRSTGCSDTWPNEPVNSCPSLNIPPNNELKTCPRPPSWCTHRGARYTTQTCNGGITQFCRDRAGQTGRITPNKGCANEWPRASTLCE